MSVSAKELNEKERDDAKKYVTVSLCFFFSFSSFLRSLSLTQTCSLLDYICCSLLTCRSPQKDKEKYEIVFFHLVAFFWGSPCVVLFVPRHFFLYFVSPWRLVLYKIYHHLKKKMGKSFFFFCFNIPQHLSSSYCNFLFVYFIKTFQSLVTILLI